MELDNLHPQGVGTKTDQL